MAKSSSDLTDFGFAPGAVGDAGRQPGLLSMEIELSLRCNFRCAYCYVPAEKDLAGELTPEEIRDAVRQAKALGARRIIVLGGEPTLYPHLVPMLRFIDGQGLEIEMFTNGSGITADLARELADLGVRVVVKLNSFDPALQDRLAGRPGAARLIRAAIERLGQAGYPAQDRFLAVSTIICRQNYDELPDLWRWARDRGIAPYVEIITPQANARQNTWLDVPPADVHRLFLRIAAIDREAYGRHWSVQPPLVGNRCLRHQFSCLLTSRGDVMPCVGVTIGLGNIRQRSLAAILAESQVLADLRNYRNTIKGTCRTCELAATCYGCRGAAYQLTGDYLASDPLCWRNHPPEA
jgi:radical SAM protein with 4Fe4S-binding SPASM domain